MNIENLLAILGSIIGSGALVLGYIFGIFDSIKNIFSRAKKDKVIDDAEVKNIFSNIEKLKIEEKNIKKQIGDAKKEIQKAKKILK